MLQQRIKEYCNSYMVGQGGQTLYFSTLLVPPLFMNTSYKWNGSQALPRLFTEAGGPVLEVGLAIPESVLTAAQQGSYIYI